MVAVVVLIEMMMVVLPLSSLTRFVMRAVIQADPGCDLLS